MNESVNSVGILVTSWDGCANIWELFFRCFFRHWPDCPYPVYLGSNTLSYDDPRVRAVHFGPEVDYSSNILKMLEQVHEEWIVLWVDDFVLALDVDTERVRRVLAIAQREGASYVNLTTFPLELTPLFTNGVIDGEVGELARGAPYRIALGTCAWRRETLIKSLRAGESPWQIERNGSLRLDAMPDRFFFVARPRVASPPIRVVNTIQEGRWTETAVALMHKEGLQHLLDGRPVEPRRKRLMVNVYSRIRYAAVWVLSTVGGRPAREWLGRLIARSYLSMQN